MINESSDVALQHPCSLLQGSVLLIFVDSSLDSSLNLMSSLTASGGVTNSFIITNIVESLIIYIQRFKENIFVL